MVGVPTGLRGNALDKAGHGTGRSCVRTAPVELLPCSHEVGDMMISCVRLVAVVMNQLFLSSTIVDGEQTSRASEIEVVLHSEVDSDHTNETLNTGRVRLTEVCVYVYSN